MAMKKDSPSVGSPPISARQSTSDAEPVDDWAGLGDPKERRKRQNRVNQRAFRERKRAEKERISFQHKIEKMIANGEVELVQGHQSPQSSPDESRLIVRQGDGETCFLGNETIDTILRRFSKRAYESYVLGFPAADQLLTLCKVNVFRAFLSNMVTLGMSPNPEWMHDDAISPFSTLLPGYVEEANLPVSLRPTAMQRMIHHPWLDFFPLPRIRDNLIAAGDFDDHDLCLDIMGFWDASNESCGLLVWGEPSDPSNWEVSENFLRKWPWIVAGCPELLESTNRWRGQRGEKLIFRYL